MALRVKMKRHATGEVVVLMANVGDNVRVAAYTKIAQRFDMCGGDIKIFEDCGEGLSIATMSKGVGNERRWYLRCGVSYSICGRNAEASAQIVERGKLWMGSQLEATGNCKDEDGWVAQHRVINVDADDTMLSDDEHCPDLPVVRILSSRSPRKSLFLEEERGLPDIQILGLLTPCQTCVHEPSPVHTLATQSALLGHWDNNFLVSTVNAMMVGLGHSKCVSAARRILVADKINKERISQLPQSNDGDRVFELPPYVGPYSKGAFLFGMERKNDCFMWSKMIETQAQIGPKLNKNKNSYKHL